MTRMKAAMVVAVLLTIATVASAQYVLRSDGYYHNNGNRYTVSYETRPGYYFNGCWVAARSYPIYTLYTPPLPAIPLPQLPSYTDPGWRGKLLDIAGAKDAREAKIRADALEQAYYMDALRFMGMEGTLRAVPAVQAPFVSQFNPMGPAGYSLSGHAYQNSYPVNASTQYGYNALTQIYGDTNLGQLYLQANQLAQGAQKLSGDASMQFGQLVGQEGQNRAKLAEHLARLEIHKATLLAMSNVQQNGFKFSIMPVQPGATQNGNVQEFAKIAPGDKSGLRQAWGDNAAKRCGECHVGNDSKGGFLLDNYLAMSREEKERRVLPRLLPTADPKIRMPRLADGSPGPAIPESEFLEWKFVE